MDEKRRFTLNEICTSYKVTHSFLADLSELGLIEIYEYQSENCIEENEIPRLEMFMRWHNELNINFEGIDVIQNLLNKINLMQEEINILKSHMKLLPTIEEELGIFDDLL